MIYLALSVRMGRNYFYPRLRFWRLVSRLFFFFFTRFSFRGQLALFIYCLCTVRDLQPLYS